MNGIRFAWDEKKNEINRQKHGYRLRRHKRYVTMNLLS